MNAKHVCTARAQERGQRHRRRQPIAYLRRIDQFSQKRFPGNANHDWSITRAEPLKLREQLEIVLKRFPETNARIKRNRHGVNIINYGARILLSKKISNFQNNIGISRLVLHRTRSSL